MSSPPLGSDVAVPQTSERTIESARVNVDDLIYVANSGAAPSITAFKRNASGDAAPVLKVAGPNTRMTNVLGVAVDRKNYIYVLDFIQGVLVFTPGADGDVAPVKIISCVTGNAIAINARGAIAIAFGIEDFPGSLSFFEAGDTGCASPDRLIVPSPALQGTSPGKTQLGNPHGVALDANDESYAVNTGVDFGIPSITVYRPNATGDVAPVREIDGDKTTLGGGGSGIVRAHGALYVSDQGGRILEFDYDADGNVAPLRTISGSNTTLQVPDGIAVGKLGNIYVADNATNSIDVFAPNANGNVKPERTIRGDATGIVQPVGIALGP